MEHERINVGILLDDLGCGLARTVSGLGVDAYELGGVARVGGLEGCGICLLYTSDAADD